MQSVRTQVKHEKPKKEGESGQIVRVEAAVHHSNLMLYSKEKGVASRVGYRWVPHLFLVCLGFGRRVPAKRLPSLLGCPLFLEASKRTGPLFLFETRPAFSSLS